MSEELKLIYTGSKVESMWLEELLVEKGIGCIRRDLLESSVQAGWADGLPEEIADKLDNFNHDLNVFQKIIPPFLDEYFASRGKDSK